MCPLERLNVLPKMKTWLLALAAIVSTFSPTYGKEERMVGYFRGVFAHGNQKYAVTIAHDVPKDLKRNERIKYHITLEQGCQVYTGRALYTPGRILIAAESIYVVEGAVEVGLGHFDLIQLQCDIDPHGIMTKVRLILPEGTIYEMAHDATAQASQGLSTAEQAAPLQPATLPESKPEGNPKPQPKSEERSR